MSKTFDVTRTVIDHAEVTIDELRTIFGYEGEPTAEGVREFFSRDNGLMNEYNPEPGECYHTVTPTLENDHD